MNLISNAFIYALAAHTAINQRRKYTGEPYINHSIEVADIVLCAPDTTDTIVAAAYLHDVVEDTAVTNDDIRETFGDEVVDLVGWLTDVSKPEDGNRATRKAIDREHIARAPAEAQTIKLADLISNGRTILTHDKKFAKVYLEEKRLLLDVLTKGDKWLHERASKIVEDGLLQLKNDK